MGCDIHIAVERKIADGFWTPVRFMSPIKVHLSPENKIGYAKAQVCSRNYEFFAAIAGVRGDGPEARGYPEDVSPSTRFYLESVGDHTPSWLPIKDFLAAFMATRWVSPIEKENAGNGEIKYPASEFFYLDEADETPDDYRVVFNFDS